MRTPLCRIALGLSLSLTLSCAAAQRRVAPSSEGLSRAPESVTVAPPPFVGPCVASRSRWQAPCVQDPAGCAVRDAVDLVCERDARPPLVRAVGERATLAVLSASSVTLVERDASAGAHRVPEAMATPFMQIEALRGETLWLSATSGTIPAELTALSLERGQWRQHHVATHPVAVWLRGMRWEGDRAAFFAQVPYGNLLRFEPPQSERDDRWSLAQELPLNAFAAEPASAGAWRALGWSLRDRSPQCLYTTTAAALDRPIADVCVESAHDPAPQWLGPHANRPGALVLVQRHAHAELYSVGERTTLISRWSTRSTAPIGTRVSCDARGEPLAEYSRVNADTMSLVGDSNGRAWLVFHRASGVERVSVERRCHPNPPGPPRPLSCVCVLQASAEGASRSAVVVAAITPALALSERLVLPLTEPYGPVALGGAFVAGRSMVLDLPMFQRDMRARRREVWLDLEALSR